MPIIIWGSRGITSTIERGTFHCPNCQAREDYALKQVRPYFTLYFIPLFPVGGGRRYVECAGCGQAYQESVLSYEPPSEEQQLLAHVYDELKNGTAVDALRRSLVETGMDDAKAEETLLRMCEGQPRQCNCGQRFHPDVRECAYCGGRL
jgi:hypothetical protein